MLYVLVGLHNMEWSGMLWESMGRVGDTLPVGTILYADGESVPYKSIISDLCSWNPF